MHNGGVDRGVRSGNCNDEGINYDSRGTGESGSIDKASTTTMTQTPAASTTAARRTRLWGTVQQPCTGTTSAALAAWSAWAAWAPRNAQATCLLHETAEGIIIGTGGMNVCEQVAGHPAVHREGGLAAREGGRRSTARHWKQHRIGRIPRGCARSRCERQIKKSEHEVCLYLRVLCRWSSTSRAPCA